MHPKTPNEDLTRLSLINNLKQKIHQLKQQLQHRNLQIQQFKRSTKTTLINEQQIQIQKLNDENKRLLLVIEEMRSGGGRGGLLAEVMGKLGRGGHGGKEGKGRGSVMGSVVGSAKKREKERDKENIDQQLTRIQQHKHPKNPKPKQTHPTQQKYLQILTQNQKLRRQLIAYRTGPQPPQAQFSPSRSHMLTLALENNMAEFDKLRQKNCELEVELGQVRDKNGELRERVGELEELLERALQINKSMKII